MNKSSVIVTHQINYNSVEINTIVDSMDEDINAVKATSSQSHLTADRIKQIMKYVLNNPEMLAAVEKALDEEDTTKAKRIRKLGVNKDKVSEGLVKQVTDVSSCSTLMSEAKGIGSEASFQTRGCEATPTEAEVALVDTKSNSLSPKIHFVKKAGASDGLILIEHSGKKCDVNQNDGSESSVRNCKKLVKCSGESPVNQSVENKEKQGKSLPICPVVTCDENSNTFNTIECIAENNNSLDSCPVEVSKLNKSPSQSKSSDQSNNLSLLAHRVSNIVSGKRGIDKSEEVDTAMNKKIDNSSTQSPCLNKPKRSKSEKVAIIENSESSVKDHRHSDGEILNSEWTREQDKELLLTCQKFGPTDEAFEKLLKSLCPKNLLQIKERLNKLMSIYRRALENGALKS